VSPSPPQVEAPSRARILLTARREFAERGFDGARLADIAREAGLSHPTLLYHFTSKAELYQAVIASAVVDWARETEAATFGALDGFGQVASLIDAAFAFFGTHHDFARILRREAMDGGARSGVAIADALRPFLARGVAFLEREMTAGRLRRHDPLELMQICYGAVFTYFSDAALRARLIDEDPLGDEALSRHRRALTELLGAALRPV
jgi:TetR/AcrR family transcriptional regulator